jgi:hypothetical protein
MRALAPALRRSSLLLRPPTVTHGVWKEQRVYSTRCFKNNRWSHYWKAGLSTQTFFMVTAGRKQ